MAKINKLARFRFEPSRDAQSVQLHIEDDLGATLELIASREQMEILADSLDDFLAETEDADEVDEAEDDLEDDDDEDSDDEDDEDAGTDGTAENGRR